MARRADSEHRGLTAEAFSRLLARLDDDPERAGEAYEALRRALTKFFDWRGAGEPDACADETIDRLARKLEEGTTVEDPRRFARGIARLVLLERWRSPEARAPRADAVDVARLPAAPPAPAEANAREACFGRCLAELAPEARQLILGYYSAEGRVKIDGRKRMAESLGLSENALRSRAQRIRDRLERCIGRCLGPRPTADTKR